MKFGKQLLKASEASTQLCSMQQWLDYKGLKKVLGAFPSCKNGNEEEVEKPNETIKTSPHERAFFRLMQSELEKVTREFIRLRVQLLQQVKQLKMQQDQMLYLYNALKQTRKEELDNLLATQLELNVKTHLDLILLESYAVLNYVGFRKILKKHDKLTGYKTQEKYMQKVVDGRPFASHPWIAQTLKLVEAQFSELKKCKESHESGIQSGIPGTFDGMKMEAVPTESQAGASILSNEMVVQRNSKRLVELSSEEREAYLSTFKQYAQKYRYKHTYLSTQESKRKREVEGADVDRKQQKTETESSEAKDSASLALESLAVAAEMASNLD